MHCHYAECRILFNVMLNVIMLSVIMLIAFMLSVVKLSVVMLSVFMLSALAPMVLLDFHNNYLNIIWCLLKTLQLLAFSSY